VISREHSPYTVNLLRRIWGHLSRRRLLQLAVLLIVMLASGLVQLASPGAVLPFLAVLSNTQQLWQQPLIQALAQQLVRV
jgi:ATP-binding cassette subfamily B protein